MINFKALVMLAAGCVIIGAKLLIKKIMRL